MSVELVLGIDCGGTHTDAALLAVDTDKARANLVGQAKTVTHHDDLPASITEVLGKLAQSMGGSENFSNITRVTLGTTLEVNALVQNRADKVGLAISAGPGLDPSHFVMGENYCIVPGGLDHRGMETGRLFLDGLKEQAGQWSKAGVAAAASVGKFSPRNPTHEIQMADAIKKVCNLPITCGHTLSGKLNFPRRIATAYFNAAVTRLHLKFLDAVEKSFKNAGINASGRLLRADGGALPFSISRREPVQSILSGPAASVMGALAMSRSIGQSCVLLLDMGGTTTDMALFYHGSPVLDRQGMELKGRRTLVRSLASVSIGIGGDSLIQATRDASGGTQVTVGPMREGPAMAFGGSRPTLLDALNTLDGQNSPIERGDVTASIAGITHFAASVGLDQAHARDLAQQAVDYALQSIAKAAYNLVGAINAHPVYTLAALKAAQDVRPEKICLVGGPAHCVRQRLEDAMGLPVEISPHSQIANAIGSALTIPTASLEIYVDTGKGELTAPAFDFREKVPASYTLDMAKKIACELLRHKLAADGIEDANVEATEADLFATLDDYGRGAKDMRVSCQVKPGIVANLEE